MSTIKKHLTTDVDHVLPTYKKLPPILTPPPSREKGIQQSPDLSISAKPINFFTKTPGSTPRAVSRGKTTPVSKSASDSLTGFKLTNGNADVKPATNPKPTSKSLKQSGGMSELISTNGVQLIGYKMTSENTVQTKLTNGWTPPGSEIPPCKVCGEKASGLHYGAYTCEACKAFFRRTLKRSTMDFQCTCTGEEKELGTDVPRKTTCPKCRYDRCLKVGMSKDAIKIGRYTISRKRQNDREVNMLKEKESDSSGQMSRGISESSSSNSPYSSGKSVSSPDEGFSDSMSPPATDESKTSRKRKFDGPEPEPGLLFRSLTNSIFHSLLENQLSSISSRLETQTIQSEVSPMEQLLMQPYVPNLETNQISGSNEIRDSKNDLLALQMGGNSHQFIAPVKGSNLHQMDVYEKGDNLVEMLFTGNLVIDETSTPVPVFAQNTAAEETEFSPIVNLLIQTDNKPINDLGFQNTEQGGDCCNLEAEHETLNEILASEGADLDADDLNFPLNGLEGNLLIGTKYDSMSKHVEACPEFEVPENCDDLFPENKEFGSDLSIDNQLTLFDQYQHPVLSPGYDITVNEMNDIIQRLVDMSQSLNVNPVKITCEEIKKRHAEYLEHYMLQKEVFGGMHTLSKEEYFQFYNQTGIDIDNRQEILIDALKHLEEAISKMVKFSKNIPGFLDLHLDDQVNLVKAGRFEHEMVNVCSYGRCLKTIMNITMTPWNKLYHVEEIGKIFPKDFCQAKAEFSRKIFMLHLSEEEAAIIKAICITFPDRCELKERVKVEAVHNKLVACLFHLLSFRHQERHLEYSQILQVLLDLRELARWDQKIIQDLFEVWPIVNNHQLVKEFVS